MENCKASMPLMNELEQIEEYIKLLNIDDPSLLKNIKDCKEMLFSDINDAYAFENEKKILDIWNDFRQAWVSTGNQYTGSIYKSPILSCDIKLPLSNKIRYSYERNIQCEVLESKAKKYRENNENWDDDHVIFSSGMSALMTLILSYKSILRNRKDKELKIFVWGAYFETRVLLDFFKDDTVAWKNFTQEKELLNGIKNEDFDILLIEPVRYDWDLDAIDISSLLRNILCLKAVKYRLIIFDTTLISQNIPMGQCLDVLSHTPYLSVVNFNSLLKLNQEGLELSNGGLISIYTSKLYLKDLSAKGIADYLRKMRTILGVGLDLKEIVLLDNPFTFDTKQVMQYSDTIFLNNALLANAVREGALFKKVSHPSKSNRAKFKWAVAPFVVFELFDDTLENYGMLLSIVSYEAKKRNLELHMGSSFGFRHCRFEVIIPKLVDKKGIFKVAMGYQNGENRRFIIELFIELSNYNNFDELFNKYAYLKPVDLNSIE